MNKAKSRAAGLIIVTVVCCVVSAVAELLIEPPYLIKSAMKIAVFLGVPLIYSKIAGIRLFENFRNVEKKDIAKLLALGAAVYLVIFGVYIATRNVFDYAELVRSQAEDQKSAARALSRSRCISRSGTRFWRSFCSGWWRF